MNTEHIEIETLSAYADGELKAVALARVEQHLASCRQCAAELARLRAAIAAAGALPRQVEPPAGTWEAIRRAHSASSLRLQPRKWWHNGWLASAAAVLLIVGTALLVPRGPGKAKGAKLGAPPATPVVLASVEKHYAPTITELRETLDAQRAELSPNTVKTLDHSLAVIDSAIAEARDALAADPASSELSEMLGAYYQHKIEFLKRATTLQFSM
jgi:hypothetical protein